MEAVYPPSQKTVCAGKARRKQEIVDMADESKSYARIALDFLIEHGVDFATLWHVAKGQKAPQGAPDWVKAAETNPGGEGNPKDEAAYASFVSEIGNSNDRKELQTYLRGWIISAFQLMDTEKHVRERGRELLEKWRVIINQMALEANDRQVAIDYLTTLAKDIRSAFLAEVTAKGKTVDSIKGKQKQACWDVACRHINEQMLSDGIHVPGDSPAPYTVQLKHFFHNEVKPFWKTVLARASVATRRADVMSRRRAKQLERKIRSAANEVRAEPKLAWYNPTRWIEGLIRFGDPF